MKILHVVKTNIGATWAFNQAKWLHDNGVEIITVLPEIVGGMAEKYKECGMKVIQGDFELPIRKPWRIFSKSTEIRNIVNKENPDIIHTHFVSNIMMLRIALRRINIPRLFQVPGPLHLENAFFRKAEIMLAKNNDYWAGACKKTCELYENAGISKDKIFLAYYGGYGGSTCDEYQESTNILHNEFNISNDKILVGMVSYFYKPKLHLLQFRGLKGHEDFIDAIALARKENPKIIGVIIGGPWGNSQKYVEKVKKYAHKKCGENIIFTGFRTDLKKIYRELDIAVHPSHSENLGGAAESLAAGVPTIATNVGGFPDIVIKNQTGFTVKARNSGELSIAVLNVSKDNKKFFEMTKNGRDLIKELLNINKTASTIFNIFYIILGDI